MGYILKRQCTTGKKIKITMLGLCWESAFSQVLSKYNIGTKLQTQYWIKLSRSKSRDKVDPYTGNLIDILGAKF